MKWLIAFLLLTTSALAEEITTGNLLPNAGDGVDWNSSSTDQINPGSSGYVSNNATMNGFTVTCPTSQSNCGYKWSVGGDFEVTGTATISKNDIALTNNTRTQDMLDNGKLLIIILMLQTVITKQETVKEIQEQQTLTQLQLK